MGELSLNEIKNWKSFEDLVSSYFREVKQDNEFNIDNVLVQPTGSGSDGGRDIIVTLTIDDSVMTFQRKWIVQCKFYNQDVNKSHLSGVNIPSLLHQYGANGYLLVCKKGYTSPVSDMFEGLNRECFFKRSYLIWKGDDLLQRVQFKNKLVEHFFPKYARFSKAKEKEAERMVKKFNIKKTK